MFSASSVRPLGVSHEFEIGLNFSTFGQRAIVLGMDRVNRRIIGMAVEIARHAGCAELERRVDVGHRDVRRCAAGMIDDEHLGINTLPLEFIDQMIHSFAEA